MADEANCKALMGFTGLDRETTSTQILPYLRKIENRDRLQEHLKSLLGEGREQAEFIRKYCAGRFRVQQTLSVAPKHKPKDNSAFPSLQSTSKPSTTPTSLFPSKARVKPKNQPLKLNPDRSLQPALGVDQTIQSNFGSSGNVYIKSRDNEEVIGKRGKQKNQRLYPSESSFITPVSQPSAVSQVKSTQPDPSEHYDIPLSQLLQSSLKELPRLSWILDCLRSSPTVQPQGTAKCFCAAKIHPLPTSPLPSQCSICGLIYCELKPPLGPCPSCNGLELLSTNLNLQETICNHFISKRDALLRMELEKYQKRLSQEKQAQAVAAKAEKSFPSLPSQAPSTKSRPLPSRDAPSKSYSTQLGGGASIEERIRIGYERLAQEPRPKAMSSTSHTVLKIEPKTGKAKIITTTKTAGQAKSKQKDLGLNEMLKLDQEVRKAWIDELDDGYRALNGLEPIIAVGRQCRIEKGVNQTNFTPFPEYIPIGVYTTDTH
ncbi:hypothetical protein O181_064675 [Austropuccinia psidii MF-1]|uniref:TRIP4/RQT4 C2HC5-type zinc finger domain-containing protein n=1 Tax=Austropuccinia psidii MF-1 TaxID=1389203 RepID=A0A9Q3ETL5_9BASI|nr:hypothetical protein [Austropuccinia psidii MF-1]